MADVFISYSREDKEFVTKLHKTLMENKRDTWVDWQGIPPTAVWMEEVYSAIEAADTFVFVISPNSVVSETCKKEIGHAAKHNKRLVPILRRDVNDNPVQEELAKRQWLFFRDQDNFETGLNALRKALDTDLEWVRAHTRLLVRAREWEKKRDGSLLLRGNDLKEAESWFAKKRGKEPSPTALHAQYILISQRHRQRVRVILSSFAVAALLALYRVSDISDFAYSQSVQSAVRSSLNDHRELEAALGQLQESELYCTWFQLFGGGKVFYFSDTKSWISTGRYVRQSILASTEKMLPNRQQRWFFVTEQQPALYDRGLFKELLRDDKAWVGSTLLFPTRPKLLPLDPEPFYYVPGKEKQPQVRIEGGIARIYATYALNSYFREPIDNECQTKVVLNVYENGYVLGGAPMGSCRDVQGIYVLVKDQSNSNNQLRGYFVFLNRYPLAGEVFKRQCVVNS